MGRHTLWQHLYYMQEALKTYFCTAFVGIGPLSNPSRVEKVPLVTTQKKKKRLLLNGTCPFPRLD